MLFGIFSESEVLAVAIRHSVVIWHPFRYKEWLEQKKQEDARQHALEAERQRLKELQLQEKKKQSDEAFNKWVASISNRPRSIPHTYARCDGAITGKSLSGNTVCAGPERGVT